VTPLGVIAGREAWTTGPRPVAGLAALGETCHVPAQERRHMSQGRRTANNMDTTGLKVIIDWVVEHDHEGLLVL
jgi:hypothetical protein